METKRSYPLYWPEGWPRTERYQRKRARFDERRSVFQGWSALSEEVQRFGGQDLIISSNLELRTDGMPRSNQRQPIDTGVAIYFKRHKQEVALACDIYLRVEDNLWALCRTIEALRQIERDGSPSLINRAFKGFMALADPDQLEWWSVLNVTPTANDDEIRTAYLRLARSYHPDAGGDAAAFDRIAKAYQLAMKERLVRDA